MQPDYDFRDTDNRPRKARIAAACFAAVLLIAGFAIHHFATS